MTLNEQSVFSLLENNASKPIEFRSTELTDETPDGSLNMLLGLPPHRVRRLLGKPKIISKEGSCMYYAGIDIAKRVHVCAVLDEKNSVVIKPFRFTNDPVRVFTTKPNA